MHNVCASFNAVTIESIIVQQARRDPENGQNNMKSYVLLCNACAMIFGAVTLSVVTEYYTPYLGYQICSIFSAMLTISSLFMNNEVESNEFAKFIDMEQAYMSPSSVKFFQEENRLTLMQMLRLKYRIIKSSLQEETSLRFHGFLII